MGWGGQVKVIESQYRGTQLEFRLVCTLTHQIAQYYLAVFTGTLRLYLPRPLFLSFAAWVRGYIYPHIQLSLIVD